MKLIACNDYIVCQELVEKNQPTQLFIYTPKTVKQYKILSKGDNLKLSSFNVNDIIICNSQGDKITLDNSIYYLFNADNIIGKIF